MIKIIDGNLFDTKADVIAHQVNLQKRMGSGVAKQVREKFPDVYEHYKNHDGFLGEVTLAIPGDDDDDPIIANLYAQDKYGYDGKQYTNMEALRHCFIQLNDYAKENNYTVAMPHKIGSVRGGAKWSEVKKMIEEIFVDVDVELWRASK